MFEQFDGLLVLTAGGHVRAGRAEWMSRVERCHRTLRRRRPPHGSPPSVGAAAANDGAGGDPRDPTLLPPTPPPPPRAAEAPQSFISLPWHQEVKWEREIGGPTRTRVIVALYAVLKDAAIIKSATSCGKLASFYDNLTHYLLTLDPCTTDTQLNLFAWC